MERASSATLISKMFIGYALNSEMRMHLNQNIDWKHRCLEANREECEDIKAIHYDGKEYLGVYTSKLTLSLSEIKELSQLVKERVNFYCPELECENLRPIVLVQVFVT